MTKQNFISMSLESGLKYVDLLCEPDDNICTLKGILNGIYCDEHGNVDCEINDCMPILRPLSDLTKEIEHGGEKFVPIERLFRNKVNESEFEFYLFELTTWIKSEMIIYRYLKKLINWHFDIADLISKNQAIDINTLETNPYK